MPTTRYLLSEQVLYRISAGFPDLDKAVQREDIYVAIQQKVNAMFRMEHFNTTLPSGERLPDNMNLAIYEGVPVASLPNGRSKAILPVMPISLPRNQGVYMIEDANGDYAFIPLLASQRMLLKSQVLINDLLGQIGYEQRGKNIEFTKDLTLMDMPTVNMHLVVFDISTYSDTDYLPIPASSEEQIVTELVNQFAGVEQLADVKPTKRK